MEQRTLLPKPLRWLLGTVVVAGFYGWIALVFYGSVVERDSPHHPNALAGQVAPAPWKGTTIYVAPWQVPLFTWFPPVYFVVLLMLAVAAEHWAIPREKLRLFWLYRPKS